MSEIIVCGHRNPDMDSVCAAYAYADLKNRIDQANSYRAVRCGHLPDLVRGQFQELGIEPPPFLKDIYTKVSDVVSTPVEKIDFDAPISDLVKIYNETHPSVVPVFKQGSFFGLLSVDDITAWFLKENSGSRPKYNLSIDNFAKSVKGTIVKRGSVERFTAELLAGAMDFDSFCQHVDQMDHPVLVIGCQKDHISYAMKRELPAIVITGTSSFDMDFSSYSGTVFCSELDTSETLRLLRMSSAVNFLLGKQGKPLLMSDLFEDGLESLASSNLRGLAVYEGDQWKGFVTRRCFLEMPRHKVIMVDHNEIQQGIPGIEKAQICEIIDHHRLDAEKTSSPIFIYAEPVGSTCTIVYHLFQRYHIEPCRDTSRVLLSGILSDTVLLKSPTTSFDDYTAADELTALGEIADMQEFGRRMYSRSNSLTSREPRAVIEADFKIYKEKGVRFGISQCEVTTLEDVQSALTGLQKALEEVRKVYDLDWTLLMITDVFKEESMLLSTEFSLARRLAYEVRDEGVFFMPGVLSRKKQLLPEVIRVVEEA